MKRFLITVSAIIVIIGIGHGGANAFLYNVDVQVSYDAAALANPDLQIQNWDWTLSGVDVPSFVPTVLSPYASNWEIFPSGAANSLGANLPLAPGNFTLATINSDTMLTLVSTNGYDAVYNYQFTGNFEPIPFTNGTFSAQLNPVPIPPTILLLGAGLVGLVGIRRRVKS